MFSGLKAACMDLRHSADRFFDNQQLFGLCIVSTLGLTEDDYELYGKYKAKLSKVDGPRKAKLILVTAMTPTKQGDGKTTISIGLADGLRKIQERFPQIGDIRQAGMHIGVEFADEKLNPLTEEATKVRTVGFKNGLILGTGGVRKNVLKVKPPMIINQAEADEVLQKFEDSVKEVFG